MRGIIDHTGIGQGPVGDYDDLIIDGGHGRIDDIDLLHGAFRTGGGFLDIIPHLKRFGQKDQDPAREVRKTSLKGQSQRHTRGCYHRHNRGGTYTEPGKEQKDQQEIQTDLKGGVHKGDHTLLHTVLLHAFTHPPSEYGNAFAADDE